MFTKSDSLMIYIKTTLWPVTNLKFQFLQDKLQICSSPVLKSWDGGSESYSSVHAKNLRFFVAQFDLNFSKCLRCSSKSELHKIGDIYIY